MHRFVLVVLFVAGCSSPTALGIVEPSVVPEEARTNLGGIYTAEKAFFGEYGTYSSDLHSLNWTPSERIGSGWFGTTVGFAFGFCSVFPTTLDAIRQYDGTRRTSNDPTVLAAIEHPDPRVRVLGDPCATMSPELAARFSATGQAHRAFAAANLDEDADLEIWSIDNIRVYRLESKD